MKRRPKHQPYDEWVETTEGYNHFTKRWEANPRGQRMFTNSRYSVGVEPWPCTFLPLEAGSVPMGTLLTIKRVWGEPVDDWRDKQRIKNDLCGPEREGMEMYPAESRLVDVADQAWIFVLPEGLQWPFGFAERKVGEGRYVRGRRGSQRPFELRPPDCMTNEEVERESLALIAAQEDE